MVNREELEKEVEKCIFKDDIIFGAGASIALVFISLFAIIAYPFWLIRAKIRRKQ